MEETVRLPVRILEGGLGIEDRGPVVGASLLMGVFDLIFEPHAGGRRTIGDLHVPVVTEYQAFSGRPGALRDNSTMMRSFLLFPRRLIRPRRGLTRAGGARSRIAT